MRQDYSYSHDNSLPEVPEGTYVEMSDHDKALCFDEICRAYQRYQKKLDEFIKTEHTYEDWVKCLNGQNDVLCCAIETIHRRQLKIRDDELMINGEDGPRYRKDYATVDVQGVLDRLCKYLTSLTSIPWKWGRDVTLDGEMDFWIKGGDNNAFLFWNFGDEFTPYYNDWWYAVNNNIPRMFTEKLCGNTMKSEGDVITIETEREVIPSKKITFKHGLVGVKNAKDIDDRLKALGF